MTSFFIAMTTRMEHGIFILNKYDWKIKSGAWLLIAATFFWQVAPHSTFAASQQSYMGGSYDGYNSPAAVQPSTTAYALSFTTSPGSSVAGQTFSVQPVVKIVDRNGVVVTGATCTSATMSVTNSSGAGTLGGTTTPLSFTSGSYTATNLFIDKPGELYTLTLTGGSGTCNPGTPWTATSSSFVVTSSDYQVKSELLYDSSATAYYLHSWLENSGNIVTDANWAVGDITTTVVDSTEVAAAAPSAATLNAGKTAFRQLWAPADLNEVYRGTITITYPNGSGKTYSGFATYNPNVQGNIKSLSSSLSLVSGNVSAIKAVTDVVNWSDISAIKDAVGANQGTSLYSKVGSILTSTSLANWDDLKVMGNAGVNWSGITALSTGQVN